MPGDSLKPEQTRMFAESGEAAQVVAGQAGACGAVLRDLGALLRALAPRLVLTVARGSSDHAATYAKYLIETRLGVTVSSYAPSVSSVYGTAAALKGTVCLAISQSGRSPDILAAADAAKSGGAVLIALVNVDSAPLARLADFVLPLGAYPETSVAATKSYLASLAMIARIVSVWSEDVRLATALEALPRALETAWSLDWTPALGVIAARHHSFVIGRGLGLSVAQEAALKFKETCQLHAEAYSAAEVMHGPAAIIDAGFPILAFSQDDETRPGLMGTLDQLVSVGARVLLAGGTHQAAVPLPTASSVPALEPIVQAQSFYRLANRLSVDLGLDPDAPPNLSKVTETV